MKRIKDQQGFTLFESVCVLLIVSILSIIPVLKYTQWQQQRSINQQLNQFERLYEKCQQHAIMTGFPSLIEVDSNRQSIFFTYSRNGKNQMEILNIGNGLSVQVYKLGGIDKLTLSSSTGRPSSLMIFTFIDVVNQVSIEYKVQMTNSKVMRHEEKL